MDQYQSIEDACKAAQKALDSALNQIPTAREFWAARETIDTEREALDAFKQEAEQSRGALRDSIQKERAAARAALAEELDAARAANVKRIDDIEQRTAQVQSKLDSKNTELAALGLEVANAGAALSIKRVEIDAASKEYTRLKASIADLKASLGATFAKAE